MFQVLLNRLLNRLWHRPGKLLKNVNLLIEILRALFRHFIAMTLTRSSGDLSCLASSAGLDFKLRFDPHFDFSFGLGSCCFLNPMSPRDDDLDSEIFLPGFRCVFARFSCEPLGFLAFRLVNRAEFERHRPVEAKLAKLSRRGGYNPWEMRLRSVQVILKTAPISLPLLVQNKLMPL